MRALHRDGRKILGCIFECDIVGDDVAVHVLVQRLAGFRLNIQQKIVRAAQHVRIGQDAALVVQEKCVTTGSRCKLLDVIGGHGVQQPRAILAGEFDFSARREVDPGGAISKRVVTNHFKDRYLK